MSDDRPGRGLSLVQLHLAVLLAGGSGLFAKAVPVGPGVLTAGRTVFGVAALLAFATVSRRSLIVRPAREASGLLLCGVVLAAHWAAFFLSIQVSSVAVGLLAFSTFPLFTTLLEPVASGERLRPEDLGLAIVVGLGLVLVVPSFDVRDDAVQGALWGVLSAFLYAILSIASRSYASRHSTLAMTFHQQLGAALASLPFALPELPEVSPMDWAWLALLGVVFTAMGQGLVVASLRHLRARTVSVVFGLEPVYAIALACLLLGERPGPRMLLGGAMICVAAGAASFGDRRTRDRPPVATVTATGIDGSSAP